MNNNFLHKEICRCGDHVTWHYKRKGKCDISKWFKNFNGPSCSCKEYIPRDNLEFLEMKTYENII